MFEDGRKTGDYEDDIKFVDITELIVETLGVEERTAL